MRELIAEEQAEVRKAKLRTASRYAFLVGRVMLGMLTAHVVPTPIDIDPKAFALDNAFLSVGQFASDELLREEPCKERKAAALFADFQRHHFGW